MENRVGLLRPCSGIIESQRKGLGINKRKVFETIMGEYCVRYEQDSAGLAKV